MSLSDLFRRPKAGARVQAVWNGAVLAESDSTVVIEGNHYFEPESIDSRYFTPSERQTVCPWKGIASYYTIEVDGQRNEAAAWYYPDPSPLAAEIKDRVAFWHGVRIVEVDDAERSGAAAASDRGR
jgi:uncharacterized protein (DUF427 family)